MMLKLNLNRKRVKAMNDIQKRFLHELHELFMRYDVDCMVICDDKIVFECGNNKLSCESYIRRENSDTAYFSDLDSHSDIYIIDIK